jgi:hypothetical protein
MIDPERFARSYYKCDEYCLNHDYHLRSARQIIDDYEKQSAPVHHAPSEHHIQECPNPACRARRAA